MLKKNLRKAALVLVATGLVGGAAAAAIPQPAHGVGMHVYGGGGGHSKAEAHVYRINAGGHY